MPHGYRDGYPPDRRHGGDRRNRGYDDRGHVDRNSGNRGYGDRGHVDRGYNDRGSVGYDDGRDQWAPPARRLLRLVRRFVVIAAIVLIPLLILLVVGVVLLIMWLFGNAGPLTGALDGVAQFVNQIAGIVNVFGGGG
ncbi:MAG: hypothetical protein HY996_08790 [Micrococcales bacterium]|nr:hypothetical protein [Micrococcales bacterium]